MTVADEDELTFRRVLFAAAPLLALVAVDLASKMVALATLPSGEPTTGDVLFQIVLRVNKSGLGTLGRAIAGRHVQGFIPTAFGYICFCIALVLVQRMDMRRSRKVLLCIGAALLGAAAVGLLLPSYVRWPELVAVRLLRVSQAVLWITIWALVSARYFKAGFLLFAASATGNLLSLLVPPFAVIDFLSSSLVFRVFGLGVFNLADLYWTSGLLTLGFATLRWIAMSAFRLGEYAPAPAASASDSFVNPNDDGRA